MSDTAVANVSNPELLKQLKDIVQPPPVSWWPPAPGWYIVLGLSLFVLIVAGYYSYRYWRRICRRRRVLAQIKALAAWFSQYTDKQYVASQLSILLRRVVLVGYSPREVAGLYGEDWLVFLDKISCSSEYTQGPGRLLITAPYASQTDENLDSLFYLVEQTIKRCL